jgi:glutathione S-transferase
MLTLWGRLNSINVQKVVWALEELGLAYERIDAGGPFGVVDTPEYRRLNPNGLVPVIEEDGFVLWESNAIVRYLAAKHGAGGLWPEDLRVRADADRWMDWQTTAFGPAMGPAFHGLIRTAPEKRDPAAIEASVAKAEPMAALLDAHLKERAYVAGDAFAMGDIAAGAATHRWLNLPIRRPALSHLEAWHRRLIERPAAAQVLVTPIT